MMIRFISRFPSSRLLPLILVSALMPLSAAEKEEGGIGLAAQVLEVDLKALAQSEISVKAALANSEKVNAGDESSRKVLAEMKDLLALKRLPIQKEEELHGDWKVRSLQAGGLGAFSYPFFKCRIFPEEKALVFHKAAGSQRRMGFLERDAPGRFLFAGAMYFSYDPAPRIYRGGKDEDRDRNCVAWLYKVGKDRLVMVFPFSNERMELYELKR
ncbi:DUF4893 domain-containing protein [Verrucomicrobiaceae bacterium 227]